MAAPPTPPPTEAELMDDVRFTQPTSTSSNPPEPSGSTSAPDISSIRGTDSNIHNFALLKDFVAANNIDDLIQVGLLSDSKSLEETGSSRMLIVAPLVLGLLCKHDLSAARHTLTSLPKDLVSLPLSRALLGLVSSAYNKKHSNVYSRANELKKLVAQPSFFHPELGAVLQTLTDLFMEAFRQKTVELIATAFTNLPLSVANTYLGMEPGRILEGAQRMGWSYDASAQMLYPVKPARA